MLTPTEETVAVQGLDAFFDDVKYLGDRTPPSHVAIEYARFVSNAAGRDDGVPEVPTEYLNNVHVAASLAEIAEATKRFSLVSDQLLATQWTVPRRGAQTHELSRHVEMTALEDIRRRTLLHCDDLDSLGRWILACEPLIRCNRLYYHPPISYSHWETIYDTEPVTEHYTINREYRDNFVADFVYENKKIVASATEDALKHALVQPIVRIDIPYIAGTTMADFAKLASNDLNVFDNFRSLLQRKFLDLDVTVGSDSFNRSLKKVALEIEDAVRMLDSEADRIRRKNYFTVTGATIGASAATLVAVFGTSLAGVAAVLGASGGLWGIAAALDERATKRSVARDNPCYFLWLLHR